MQIVYIGNFQHPFCTEVHIASELEALGHRVSRLQEPPGGADAGFLQTVDTTVARKNAGLVLFTRTWGLPRQATQLWRRLEDRGVVTASYHLDLYVGLRRERGLRGDPFWTTQHVFTPDGDPESARVFERYGISHHWQPPAVVSSETGVGRPRPAFDYDVVFVGSRQYHSEWPWRVQLLDHLEARYGDRFRRFGGDTSWGRNPNPRPVRNGNLNDLYATARVVVGDSLCLPGHVNYWSDRPYETVGRGGFLLMPAVPGLDEHFVDGEHLRYYDVGDLDSVDDLVDHYVAHPAEAREIAENGRAHVRAHHTYRHRLAGALDVMGLE